MLTGNATGLLANDLDSPVNDDLPQLHFRGMNRDVELTADLTGVQDAHRLRLKASLSIKEDKISGTFILIFPSAPLARVITRLLCPTPS